MMERVITINQRKVYDEVAKTTAYTGAKIDGETYERVFTTDEDQEMLERFWQECKSALTGMMKRWLVGEEEVDGVYRVTLSLSSAFDASLLGSVERSVFSYFVMGICAKWYAISHKEEAQGYATEAGAHAEEALRKLYYKKKSTRPTY